MHPIVGTHILKSQTGLAPEIAALPDSVVQEILVAQEQAIKNAPKDEVTPKKGKVKTLMQKMRLVKPDTCVDSSALPALNDSDLRDQTLSLVRASNINFSTHYLKPTDAELKARAELKTWDGIMHRPEGYFRIAEEKETGIRLLLFEFDLKHLSGEEQEDGRWGLSALNPDRADESPDVYLVGAFHPNADQPILNEAINEFCKKLRNDIVPELDLYMRDETHYDAEHLTTDTHVFRAANTMVAFGYYHDAEHGGWQSTLYSTLIGDQDGTGRFKRVRIKRGRNDKKFTNAFVMNQDDLKNGQDFGEVFRHSMKYWSLSSLKRFKGQDILSEGLTLRQVIHKKTLRDKAHFTKLYTKQQSRKAVRATGGFVAKRWREYGVSGAVSTFLSFKVLKFDALRGTILAIAGIFGSTIIGKYIDEKTQGGVRHVFEDRTEYRKMKEKLPQNRDYSRFFVSKQKTKQPRFLQKVDAQFIGHLNLLRHQEAGVMDSLDKTVAVTRRNWKEQYLGGLEVRTFAKANAALSSNVVLKILPSGVLSLTHICPEFNRISKYYTYRKEFATSGNAPLHPLVRETLEKGIFKVDDQRGDYGLDVKQMRRCDFTKEMKKVFAEVKDIDGTPTEVPQFLSALFNPNAKGDPLDVVADLLKEAGRVHYEPDDDPLDRLIEMTRPKDDKKRGRKTSIIGRFF